ncbi:MAG: TonB-dependent receptor [Bryobacterales bacterium]|nr:TonB-dependent receptor [Bryobacterales bacterium]MBV9401243.1 TonB-dependent receptor [Bryobacterales bacterium]
MRFFRCFAVVLLVSAGLAWAQSTAQIQGTVRDASGGAVPGAEVKATQTETGVSRSTTTGADGGYVLSNLAIGPYTLEVTKEGFSKYAQTGIVLAVADSPTVDVPMKVGSLSEQVQVEANAALVETQNSGVSSIMENQRILDLPLNGRNPSDLIQLAGAAVAPGPAFNASSRSFQGVLGGQGYSVAGGQTSGVTYVLDGSLHNNPFDNLNLPLPFPDALQEFKLETSALMAENGIHSGATVNAVTKSGTNAFHGDVFEFIRNNIFNATNPAPNTAKGPDGKRLTDGLKRNQFGGTLGGPILKNKLFFFTGFQETVTRQNPASSFAFVPTAQMLAGDWTTFASTQCQVVPLTLKSPFVGNKISPALYDPASLKILTYLPQTNDPCGKVSFISPIHQNEYQVLGKVDYQITAKNALFGRYIATTLEQTPPYELLKNVLNTTTGGRDNLAQTVTVGDTHLISPTTVNSFHLAMNRTAIHRTNAPFFGANDVGINVYNYVPDFFILAITGGFSTGSGIEVNSIFHTTLWELGNELSMVKGSHQFSFGGNTSLWNSASYANVRSSPNFSFDGSQTGAGLGDFMLGKLALLDQATPNTVFDRQWYLGLYAQDTWKAMKRLTINLGLRWEPFFPQIITNGAIYNFSLQRFTQGVVSQTYPNAPPGLYFPGDPGFPDKSGHNMQFKNFGPRVGLAWDPFGDSKTSIRAAYGLFYDFVNGQFYFNTTVAPPFGDEIKLNFPAGGFRDPWAGQPGGNPYPIYSHNLFTPYAPYITLSSYDMPSTRMHSWNLSIQRQISQNWLVSANYVGNETEHLWTSTQENQPVFLGLGACTLGGVTYPTCSTTANYNQRRQLSLINPTAASLLGYVDVFDPGGTQSYNGLILGVQHRYARGLTISGNYTWSRCIGDYSQGFTTPNPGTGYQVPTNRRFDRGNCAFDRRQNFNLSASYQIPRFEQRFVRMAVSDWRISPIFRYITGQALTITTGVDRNLADNTATQRPNQTLPDVYAGGFLNYLNPAAFQQPALGTLGNMGTYAVYGPGMFEIDAGLARVFPIREQIRMEIRAEAFNLPNFYLRGNPGTLLSATSTFGQITTALNPRVLQFAAKITF